VSNYQQEREINREGSTGPLRLIIPAFLSKSMQSVDRFTGTAQGIEAVSFCPVIECWAKNTENI
jgi:hypothetical protein